MTATNYHGLDTAQVWDTASALSHLQGVGVAKSEKTAERRLNQLGLLPPILSADHLADEDGKDPNWIILNWAIGAARKKRHLVLFAQLHETGDGKACLHLNDARAARYWTRAASSAPELENALNKIQTFIGKTISIFPHGRLVTLLANITPPEGVNLTPQVYQPKLSNLDVNVPRKKLISPHLKRLEDESIFILREAVAEAENPVMLYSIGKDSGVMVHLARKAFFPGKPPFPLLHVDTRWKFQEMYAFRDNIAKALGMELIVHINPEAIQKNINPFDHGSSLHTDITKTEGLKQALNQHKFDVIFGGARRDEEKSRAKERVFSFRTSTHRWDPKNQRPELWNLYNTRINPGESIRVFPLSNWTELDIWQYIYQENIPVVPLYFAKPRAVVIRPEMIMMVDDARCRLLPEEEIQIRNVRFRTLGCYPLTGAVESNAQTVEEILLELINTHQSERQGRRIDTDSASSMEKKKQEGYF